MPCGPRGLRPAARAAAQLGNAWFWFDSSGALRWRRSGPFFRSTNCARGSARRQPPERGRAKFCGYPPNSTPATTGPPPAPPGPPCWTGLRAGCPGRCRRRPRASSPSRSSVRTTSPRGSGFEGRGTTSGRSASFTALARQPAARASPRSVSANRRAASPSSGSGCSPRIPEPTCRGFPIWWGNWRPSSISAAAAAGSSPTRSSWSRPWRRVSWPVSSWPPSASCRTWSCRCRRTPSTRCGPCSTRWRWRGRSPGSRSSSCCPPSSPGRSRGPTATGSGPSTSGRCGSTCPGSRWRRTRTGTGSSSRTG